MRKSFFSAACALAVGALLGSFGARAKAAPASTPTNLQLLDQLIAHSKDGRTVAQGDMILSVPALRAYRNSHDPSVRGTRSAFYRTTYWTVVGGKVPYTLAADLPQAQQDAFVQACREWEKWANLKFTPRTGEANYINVIAGGNDSNSQVGMVGGEQTMRLATWADKGTACHELAHALGVMHEQSRSDRDNYVEIKVDNVDPALAYNYAIINDSDNHREYDFESIMHYGPWGFAIDPNKPTMVCKPPYERFQNIIGQRNSLTELDKAGMADIYGFPPGVTATPVPTPTLPPRPTLVCDPVSVPEGTPGKSGPNKLTFRIGLSYVPNKDVSFAYKIVRYVPGGMTEEDPNLNQYSAIPGEDYVADSMEGSVMMPAATEQNSGDSTRIFEIAIPVTADSNVENDESLMLVLSDPVNVRFSNDAATLSVKGTITNDDFATPVPTATTAPTPKPTAEPIPVTPPVARVSLSPVAPGLTSVITANVGLTPSRGTTVSFVWSIKGVVVARNVGSLNLSRFSGLKRGDLIKVEVTPTRNGLVGDVATAQVAIANAAPVARGASLTTLSAVPVSLALTGSDIDGDALTFGLVSKPANGAAAITVESGKSTFMYRSKPGFVGTETISVFAYDGKLRSAPVTIEVKVGANAAPQLIGVSPATGTVKTGASLYFTQVVKDADKNFSSISFVVGNSARSASVGNALGLVYDMATRTVRLASDDGSTLSEPVRSGVLLENSRAKVVLRSASLDNTSGTMTFQWQVIFKAGWTGTKTLWARVDDTGALVDGFRTQGTITLVDPAGVSTKGTSGVISAGNS